MSSKPNHSSSFFTAASCSWLVLSCALLPLNCWSQSEADEDSQETSQHVEESEESFRRRMELEEAGDRADIILDRSSGPLKAPEGMDALPYESRKHLRDQLRNVIIEQGEWQPEDVNGNYPYTPSAAAQKNPELHKQEEKAWGELVKEYHKREAAALEAGGGRSSGTAAGQGQSAGQAGSSGSESSKSGKPGSKSADTRPKTAATSSTASGAGVSQSALEFLKGQSNGQAGGQPGGQTNAQANGQAGSQAENPTAAGAAKPNAEQPQVAEASQKESSSSKKDKEKSDKPPPPPGSLAIAELLALEEGQKRKATEEQQAEAKKTQAQQAESETSDSQDAQKQDTQSLVIQNEVDAPPPPPGTIAIPELEKLQGLQTEAIAPRKNPR